MKYAPGTTLKAWLVLTICGVLTGCGPADIPGVAECEAFIKSQLRSPSTYSRVKLETSDLPDLPPAQFRGITNQDPPTSVSGNVGLLLVAIEYDAANAYGTPVREKGKCAFTLAGRHIYDLDGVRRTIESGELSKLKMSTANTNRLLREAEHQTGKEVPEPVYDCCIDW